MLCVPTVLPTPAMNATLILFRPAFNVIIEAAGEAAFTVTATAADDPDVGAAAGAAADDSAAGAAADAAEAADSPAAAGAATGEPAAASAAPAGSAAASSFLRRAVTFPRNWENPWKNNAGSFRTFLGMRPTGVLPDIRQNTGNILLRWAILPKSTSTPMVCKLNLSCP